MPKRYIVPDWPLPQGVQSLVTTRKGGVSGAQYTSNNMAFHVEDDKEAVRHNRARLRQQLPAEPYWLNQTHSTTVLPVDGLSQQHALLHDCDGTFSRRSGNVCVVMTADCLPLLLCSVDGKEIAAVHAGWRGLANGIISNAVKLFLTAPKDVLVYLGPAISNDHFEVGEDVRQVFMTAHQKKKGLSAVEAAFQSRGNTEGVVTYSANLYALARIELKMLGVERIYGGGMCTFTDQDQFFSYRRDGSTGRMASMIWRDK
ncbi:peptidoglycan editing factor PgeF [Teredinibacter purpureus]|uniref:peptidoglycan editing factor PgeF n=1 Tax=Teredinibacter purpureus TaxID=2731756 RepID=UPI0005F83DEF|nr:peptidoglycan editing factor PgeF [Teredinibacter purpureus]